MDLAVLVAFNHAGVFEIDEILLLHRSELVQHLVSGVHAVEVEYDQIAHEPSPRQDRVRPCLLMPSGHTPRWRIPSPRQPSFRLRTPEESMSARVCAVRAIARSTRWQMPQLHHGQLTRERHRTKARGNR